MNDIFAVDDRVRAARRFAVNQLYQSHDVAIGVSVGEEIENVLVCRQSFRVTHELVIANGIARVDVKGHGGSRNAAKSAKSAIRTTINIGDLFEGVSKKGILQVLKEFQIPTEGRKPKEILNDIINILAPTPDLNDDSVARKALIITMSIIYEKFDDEKQDITLLDSIDPDISKMLVEKYIETFIYERLIHDVGSRIEKKAENSAAAAKIEQELKDYIETKVSTTLNTYSHLFPHKQQALVHSLESLIGVTNPVPEPPVGVPGIPPVIESEVPKEKASGNVIQMPIRKII